MKYVTGADLRTVHLQDVRTRPQPVDFVAGLVAGFPEGDLRIVTGIFIGPVTIDVLSTTRER